jgi:hypothetical protein
MDMLRKFTPEENEEYKEVLAKLFRPTGRNRMPSTIQELEDKSKTVNEWF